MGPELLSTSWSEYTQELDKSLSEKWQIRAEISVKISFSSNILLLRVKKIHSNSQSWNFLESWESKESKEMRGPFQNFPKIHNIRNLMDASHKLSQDSWPVHLPYLGKPADTGSYPRDCSSHQAEFQELYNRPGPVCHLRNVFHKS